MRHHFALALALVMAPAVRADDGLTPLNPPRPVGPPVESKTFMRKSYYERWQYYAVDQQGYFRPRVVLAPPMPYYLVDGRPYPLLPVRPRDYIPYILD
jgi:hypothetical protein